MPRTRKIDDLKYGERIRRSLFHESGTQLVPAGTTIDLNLVFNLRNCGISTVFEVSQDDNIFEFVSTRRNQFKPVAQINQVDTISCPVIDPKGKILLGKRDPMNTGKRQQLLDLGVEEVLVRKKSQELKEWQVEKFKLLNALDNAMRFLEDLRNGEPAQEAG